MIEDYLFKPNNVTGMYSINTGKLIPKQDSVGFDNIKAYFVIVDSNALEVDKETYEEIKAQHYHSFSVRRINEDNA